MKKIIWGIVAGLLVLAVIALIIVATFLDGIVKKGVETVGPKITGVSIKLDEMHIGLLTGSGRVKGLVVGNPEGYKAPAAISVGLAEIRVDPLSIMSAKIVMRSVHVESPEITFEGGLSENNLGKIMDNINMVSRNGGPAPAATTPGGNPKPAKKIEVDDLLITGAKVHVSLAMLGGKEMTLSLPEIHLSNLGKGNAGLTATDLTRAVFQSITSATIKAVADAVANVGGDVKKLGGTGINKLKSGLGGLLGK
ncbi:MAG TPA: hypothetical protein VIK35_03150 [Verrucomicrobiae bacterium]